jgi:DNA-directed RNA polymerase specialized sigma24 family protein
MSRTQLHLVDGHGRTLSSANKAAAEAAFAWALREFPHIDPVLLTEWTEEVGKAIEARAQTVVSPKRYAFAALHGKVRQWMRSRASKEISVGIGVDLEQWAGVESNVQRMMDRTILFDQLKTRLNDRDNHILVLLLQDITSPAGVAEALGVSYPAAAKAIQRVKERIAATLSESNNQGPESSRFCEAKS